MHFRSLTIALLVLSNISWGAPGRAPAVEDFVGIEVEQVEAVPHGDENLFNLEQDVKKIDTARQGASVDVTAPAAIAATESIPWSLSKIMGILVILALPLVSWLHVLNHMRKKASVESASNIEVLEKYRQEREQSKNQKSAEVIKKVS